jgi:probable O-glycosylation ligase (exosortase A-associated)
MKGLILTYLMAYGGAAAALFQPLIGLTVYLVFSVARPQQLYGWAGDMRGISEIVAIATLVGWFLKGFGNWDLKRAWPYVWLLLGFLGFTCVSAFFAADQAIAWNYVIQRSKIVAMFLVGMTLIDSTLWVHRIAWALVIAQGVVGFEMNLSYAQGYNKAAVEGLLGDNNSFAISMVGGIGPAIFLGLAAREWWKKAVAFACGALMLHTVLLTFSRGGMLALVVTGVVVFVLMPKRPSLVIALVLASLLTARLMGKQVTERFMTIFVESGQRDGSAESRLELWKDCLEVIERSPIIGIGPSHFPLVAHEFGWPPGKSAHSLWVQGAAELGLPAMLCLLGFNLLAIFRAGVLAHRHARDDLGPIGLYVFSGLCGFVVAAQFVSIEGLELPYFTVLLAAAVAKVQPEPEALAIKPVSTAPTLPQWTERTP